MAIGIYIIENTVNGKVYIGQSVDIDKRWKDHKRCNNKTPLYNAFRKYDECDFKWEVLLECPEESLDFFEKAMISGYNCIAPNGYNLTDGGSNGRLHAETKAKISASKKGVPKPPFSEEHCKNLSAAGKKRTQSALTRQKISDALKGVPKKPFTDKHKQNMSAAGNLRCAKKTRSENT